MQYSLWTTRFAVGGKLGVLAGIFGGEQDHITDLSQIMYNNVTQTELGSLGQNDGKRRSEPRSEDVVEGEYQEI